MGKKVHRGSANITKHTTRKSAKSKRGQMRARTVSVESKPEGFNLPGKGIVNPGVGLSIGERATKDEGEKGGAREAEASSLLWDYGASITSRTATVVTGAVVQLMKDALVQGTGMFFRVASAGEISEENAQRSGEAFAVGVGILSRKTANLTAVQKGSELLNAASAKAVSVAKPLVGKAEQLVKDEVALFLNDKVGYMLDRGSSPLVLGAVVNLTKSYTGLGQDNVAPELFALFLSHHVRVDMGLEAPMSHEDLILGYFRDKGVTTASMDMINGYKKLNILQNAILKPLVHQVSKRVVERLNYAFKPE